MFQIGEFSIITKLSIKALRFYHEEGILIPDYIDDESGYRYYRDSSTDKAIIIKMLRDMEFTIKDIKDILINYSEDTEVLDFLQSQSNKIEEKIKKYQDISGNIKLIIDNIRSNEMNIKKMTDAIIEKKLEDIIFAGHRFKGKYNEVGKAFKIVGKIAGRFIAGKALSLYYDGEYKEHEADIEGGFPVSKTLEGNNINCRVLSGGKAVTLIHKGPYDTIAQSYRKIFEYVEKKKYKLILPSREIYLKGPGIIFRGNPEKYITEIQLMFEK